LQWLDATEEKTKRRLPSNKFMCFISFAAADGA
jgi:hypothetical protein